MRKRGMDTTISSQSMAIPSKVTIHRHKTTSKRSGQGGFSEAAWLRFVAAACLINAAAAAIQPYFVAAKENSYFYSSGIATWFSNLFSHGYGSTTVEENSFLPLHITDRAPTIDIQGYDDRRGINITHPSYFSVVMFTWLDMIGFQFFESYITYWVANIPAGSFGPGKGNVVLP
ncbi:hypothetical protein SELMODRAFT_449397 [Selaginella moellendorffii]|uniref:Uncharacterized protein n=1 Tax=Selaginella moellendorffii TaxID=88036 RepID=D8TGC8_SELML|nr:hypothetical protein SELMODRAFT_449397 [Selaginella moellendorffii]